MRYRYFRKTVIEYCHDSCNRCGVAISVENDRNRQQLCNTTIQRVTHNYFLTIRFQIKEISSDINTIAIRATRTVAAAIQNGLVFEGDPTDVSEIGEGSDDE